MAKSQRPVLMDKLSSSEGTWICQITTIYKVLQASTACHFSSHILITIKNIGARSDNLGHSNNILSHAKRDVGA
jgi:hypothetical protein